MSKKKTNLTPEFINKQKTILTPEFINKQKTQWYILTMSLLIKKAFKDFPQIGIGYVEFEGSNHQQIDLENLKKNNLVVCGMTFSRSPKIGVKDCSFQAQLIAQIDKSNLHFIHFTTKGELCLKNILNDVNLENFLEVAQALEKSKKAVIIPPSSITINNYIFINESETKAKRERSMQGKILAKLAPEFLVKEDQWYQYEKPIWVPRSTDFIAEEVRSYFRKVSKSEWISTPFFNSLINDLKTNCIKCVEFDPENYVCFQNGILNLKTMDFQPAEDVYDIYKSYYFRDYLPYGFQTLDIPQIKNIDDLEKRVKQNMPKISQWFLETLDEFEIISIVLCFAPAVIKQYKLDRFLFFSGPANSGKSTTLNFFDLLFIKSAVITKQLSDLSSSFGLAELIETNVRLITIRDAEGAATDKSVAILKNLTSNNEPISITRKYLNSVNHIFSGGVIIASNYSNIFKKSAKGILEKRIIPIEFPNVISPENQKDYKFFPEDEMGFFLSLVIKMEKTFILKTLRSSHKVKSIEETRSSLLETGEYILIIEFIKNNLIYKSGSFIAVGATLKVRERLKEPSLYKSYLDFLEENYPKRVPEIYPNFRDKIETVFQNLGWSYLDPPVIAKKNYFEVIGGEKEEQRSYRNISWITPKEEGGDDLGGAFAHSPYEL